jgi:hypothetical protein
MEFIEEVAGRRVWWVNQRSSFFKLSVDRERKAVAR